MPNDFDELRTRAEWYEQLLTSTRDAVVCIDGGSRIVLFNAAAEQMFGYAASEVRGQDVEILMAEPHASEHGAYVARYERTREPRAIGRIRSVAARRKNGEVFPIELSVTEVEAGDTIRYGAFIRDISDKVSLQERLLERERLAAIGTTAASFAHELGNPLNSMYMHAQLLERRLARADHHVDPRVASSVAALLGETRRLSHLLDEFRALARRHRLSVAPTDLVGLIHEVLGTETPSLNARGINVVRGLPERLRTSFIDAEKVRQVLLNLIKNAADAMPDGGTVSIHVTESDSRVHVEVHDTGCGVPGDIDPFEAFVTTKPEGTGLGLPVALQIVQAHGGSLRHEPAQGGGTVFILELPRRDRFVRGEAQ
ncbi:two-component system sensor histidine kinase NtrB [Paraliomyxa miuraensis]|uniref:two-component system sensor histidine kinase NtrB n=1 Tax=Paraliomyxa miuraensis TaxID=376150 RepID=UPI002253C3C1|nr:PAS domain S-box protein [Paraliomyxa miuraensis]MCX4246606.1 PAS domain S-box protein [Paraliomyxa miuraensis]